MPVSLAQLGLAEAAHALSIPYQQAHRLLLLGILAGEKRGGRWLVDAEQVRELAASGRVRQLVNVPTLEGHDATR